MTTIQRVKRMFKNTPLWTSTEYQKADIFKLPRYPLCKMLIAPSPHLRKVRYATKSLEITPITKHFEKSIIYEWPKPLAHTPKPLEASAPYPEKNYQK